MRGRSILLCPVLIGSLACLCAEPPPPDDTRPISPEALRRITARVTAHGDPNEPTTARPLLTLEEFFDGNQDPGSIAANLTTTHREMHTALLAIRSRSGVHDVRVQVTYFDDPTTWPYSDTVWIVTSADPQRVRGWFPSALRPDECFAGWQADQRYEPLEVPDGSNPIGCWWD